MEKMASRLTPPKDRLAPIVPFRLNPLLKAKLAIQVRGRVSRILNRLAQRVMINPSPRSRPNSLANNPGKVAINGPNKPVNVAIKRANKRVKAATNNPVKVLTNRARRANNPVNPVRGALWPVKTVSLRSATTEGQDSRMAPMELTVAIRRRLRQAARPAGALEAGTGINC